MFGGVACLLGPGSLAKAPRGLGVSKTGRFGRVAYMFECGRVVEDCFGKRGGRMVVKWDRSVGCEA